MCGIAGIVGKDRSAVEGALSAMTRCQAHRGPDDDGHEYLTLGARAPGWTVGLGHRRLSILDLSPAGHQPMVHPQTGDVLVYNGEWYNYQEVRRELEREGVRFRGHSDSEVLLYALVRWGDRALERIAGMYAFAYLSPATGRLLIARDPLGIKPLYVAQRDGCLALASEVRGVVASGLVERRVDRRALAGLLAWGAVQEPCTFVEGVRAVGPGTVETYQIGADGAALVDRRRHWTYPATDPAVTEAAAVEEVRRRMDIAVAEHLIADVPVGVFLSSGIDSTIIASLAARHTSRLRTFTVGFADNHDMSESRLAAETAGGLGVEHTEIQVLAADAEAAASGWLASLDQPSMDGLNVYIISRAVREHGIVVALSGQGGDELFGGYPSFADVPRMRAAVGRLAWVPPGLRARAFAAAAVAKPEAVRLKFADMARSRGGVLDLYLHRRRLMSDSQMAALGMNAGALGLHESFLPREALDEAREVDGDAVATIARLESRFYMGNMLLHDGDGNGMAHGLEIRVPFLDKRVIDLAYTIPGPVLLPEGRATKHLLRRAFAPMLRGALLEQGKKTFTLPIKRWMLGPMRDRCEAAVACVKGSGLLRPEGVEAVWRSFQRDPESQIWSRAFTICVLGCYLESWGEPRAGAAGAAA